MNYKRIKEPPTTREKLFFSGKYLYPPTPAPLFKQGRRSNMFNTRGFWNRLEQVGTGETGSACSIFSSKSLNNQPLEQVEQVKFHLLHMRARARIFSFLFLSLLCNYILIIIKNTCSTCSHIGIIKQSPVPATCSNLFHLFQEYLKPLFNKEGIDMSLDKLRQKYASSTIKDVDVESIVYDKSISPGTTNDINHSVPIPPISGALSVRAPSSWQDIPSVVRLSAYVKENKEHGITIVKRGNIPAIRFNPGLCRKDQDIRWQIASNIERLFWDAFEDLRWLIKSGKLDLPESPSLTW